MKIENLKKIAKQEREKISEDWLKRTTELKDIAKGQRQAFEKLPRLDLRGTPKGVMTGTEDDPAVILVRFLTEPKTVKTEKMTKPMDVVELEVLHTSLPTIDLGKYSVWLNTTVLHNQIHDLPAPVKGAEAVIAYYGKVKNQKGQSVYIYKAIPYTEH